MAAIIPADNDKYEVLDIIGRGAFGIIRKVRRKQDGLILCRKEINYLKMSQKERDQLTAEFSILSSLKHSNIVGYFHREHLKQTQELYMYMEYCGGGDLGQIIKELKDKNEYAKEDFVWRIFAQLMTALYRCHYGIDPSEPGTSISRKDSRHLNSSRPSSMILHRDLKPENIFLGEDQAVKLGDFGLSKLMQSHDFASTYVGTPFYMSPEICAAEKYTLQSDIWSVGCIIYELCTREPPFNANSHLQLVQRIRKGVVKPLPDIYSPELQSIIMSCLRTNPTLRPDTASLISHPFIWIARKQLEMVAVGKALKAREEAAETKARRAEDRVAALDAEKKAMKAEVDNQLRLEWEVKARLEIDRQVEAGIEALKSKFETEVAARVSEAFAKHTCRPSDSSSKPASEQTGSHHPSSSFNTAGESEWASTTELTDLSDLSIQSPGETKIQAPLLRKTKTPFARSKTTFDSPADIQMSEPSPMSISGLALSPRRHPAAQTAAGLKASALDGKMLFADGARARARWQTELAYDDDSDDDKENEVLDSDEDDFPDLPSPTRPKGVTNTDPFKSVPLPVNSLPSKSRPGMLRQHTIAGITRLATKPSLFQPGNVNGSVTAQSVRAGIATANHQSSIPRSAIETDSKSKQASPVHKKGRLSKIPSRGDLREQAEGGRSTSPLRRAATITHVSNHGGMSGLKSKLAPARTECGANLVAGRTRVELAQARAGGRPMSADFVSGAATVMGTRPGHEKELPPPPIWDDELEMPSPFLKREVRTLPARGLR